MDGLLGRRSGRLCARPWPMSETCAIRLVPFMSSAPAFDAKSFQPAVVALAASSAFAVHIAVEE
jgi:hypothetical protein